MFRTKGIVVAAVCVALPRLPTAIGQSSPPAFPLTNVAIAHALQTAGLDVSETQIQGPGQLFTTAASPVLDLDGAQAVDRHRLRVRLSCKTPHECLPFFVTVSLDSTTSAAVALASLRSSSHPDLPIRTSGPLLRAGDHVLLLMEDNHMQIAIPVVSIDTGTAGAEVRVTSLDHKKMFRGKVVGSGMVEGDIP